MAGMGKAPVAAMRPVAAVPLSRLRRVIMIGFLPKIMSLAAVSERWRVALPGSRQQRGNVVFGDFLWVPVGLGRRDLRRLVQVLFAQPQVLQGHGGTESFGEGMECLARRRIAEDAGDGLQFPTRGARK